MYTLLDPGAVTIRAVTIQTLFADSSWTDPTTASPSHLRDWVCRVWSDTAFADAVTLASPSLADRVHRVCSAAPLPDHRLRRVATSLTRYLLRARSRPTPNGLFAGVAPVLVGSRTRVRWGGDHHAIARPDASWLTALADHLLDQDHDVPVVTATTAQVRGERLLSPWQPGDSSPVEAAPVSVRHTTAVAMALETARIPRSLSEIASTLATTFPTAAPEAITAMLSQLVRHRLLVSAVRPPMSAVDPLGYLLTHLPDRAHEYKRLHSAHALLARHNQSTTGPAEQRRLRRSVTAHPREGSSFPMRLAVDTRLDAHITIPPVVVRAARDATATLAALAANPEGAPEWADYHARCLDVYGPGAVIGVRELTGPAGIGLPAGYRGSHLSLPRPRETERDTHLLELAHTAALEGSVEVALDTPALAQARGDLSATTLPPHLEIRAQVHATTPQALDTGDFTLWVNGVSRAVGTLTGRFAHLDGMDLKNAYRKLPTATAGALAVQISAPPMVDTATNIARTPPLLPCLLVVDEHPPPSGEGEARLVSFDDLAVHIEADQLRLVLRSTGQVIEPLLLSALEPRWYTHPLVRFCYELPRAHTTPHLMFTWPASTRAWVFLPRLRSGRTVVSPALWRLRAADIPEPDADSETWGKSLRELQGRRRLPDTVHLVEGERHLRLDLDQAAHRHLLRAHLRQNATATLAEAPPSEAFGWCGGRAHELVLPMASTTAPRPAPSPNAGTRPTVHLPGTGPWLCTHLHTDPDLHTQILTDYLPQLWQAWEHIPQWWFVRYRDAEGPHLRVRIHAPDQDARTLRLLGEWGQSLRHAGMLHRLTIQTYRPETGRYGSGEAMEAAEKVFVADTRAALTQLELAHHDTTELHALTAASLTDLAVSAASSPPRGMDWLIDHLPRSQEPIDRTAHAYADRLLATASGNAPTAPAHAELRQAWKRRAVALDAYRNRLATPDAINAVLPSLMHMHHNRVLGPHIETERQVRALTRAVVLTRKHARTVEKP